MHLKKGLIGAMLAVTTYILPTLAYGQAYGTVGTQVLNIREGAKTTADIVKKASLGDTVEIVAEEGDWLKIALSNGKRAYVKAEYIAVHRVDAVVNSNSLNVRDYPSTNSGAVIGKLYSGDGVTVNYRVGEWYKITKENTEGFVHKDYLESDFLSYISTKSLSDVKKVTSTVKTEEVSTSGDAIVSYAKQFLGNPYQYGGNSLTNGVDCSGFTSQVMKHFGISLKRSSSEQYANNGYEVSTSNLKKGDLVFYGYSGNVSHVGIYIGNEQIIHANDERTGITISSVYAGKPIVGAKRVL